MTHRFLLSVVTLCLLFVGCQSDVEISTRDAYTLMNRYYTEGDYQEALRYCDIIVQRQPTDFHAYLDRCICYLETNRLDLALSDANRAVELGPHKYTTFEIRSEVWSLLGNHRQAVADITTAMKLQPNDYLHYNCRGYDFEQLFDYQRAVRDYRKAVELNPESSSSWNNLAMVLAMAPDEKARNGKQAIDAAKQAVLLATERDRGQAWDTLGAAYAEQGDFSKAIRYANKALKRLPKSERSEVRQRIANYGDGKPARLPSSPAQVASQRHPTL